MMRHVQPLAVGSILPAVLGAWALTGPLATAAPVGPVLFGQAAAALTPGADTAEAMRQGLPQGAQRMANNFNNAGTADAAPAAGGPAPAGGAAAAAGGGPSGGTDLTKALMKYGPSYVIMVLSISLGLFVVCRPAGFSLASLAEPKKPKK